MTIIYHLSQHLVPSAEINALIEPCGHCLVCTCVCTCVSVCVCVYVKIIPPLHKRKTLQPISVIEFRTQLGNVVSRQYKPQLTQVKPNW